MDRIRLGILQVNHDKSETIGDHFPDDSHRFRDLFDQLQQRFTYRVYMTIGGELPQDLDEQDAYLITGSPLSVNEDHAWLAKLFDFVRACDAAKKPLLGTCFGHQAIAKALGADVGYSEAGWNLRVEPTRFTTFKPWMQPQQDLNFYCSHKEQVRSLPEGCELLGSSDGCAIGSFCKGNHIFTTQMHPEFNRPFMEAIIDVTRDELSADAYQTAKDTLATEPDGLVFARWATRFFLQQGQEA
jgi:GMP synthase-like glutamine amidotransferase